MFNLTPTTELEALKELDLMNSNASMGLEQLKHYAGQSFNAFWYGTISPIIKVQMLGNSALEVFTVSATTQAFIKQLDPTWIELSVPVGYTVTFNEDGSAVIEEVIDEPVIEEVVEEQIIEEIIPE
jgi:hypothetical protein